MTSLNWDSEFILISDYTFFILIYTSSLYSYLGTYLLNEWTFPISLPSHSPLWVYLPRISFIFPFSPHNALSIRSQLSMKKWYSQDLYWHNFQQPPSKCWIQSTDTTVTPENWSVFCPFFLFRSSTCLSQQGKWLPYQVSARCTQQRSLESPLVAPQFLL